MSRRILLRPQAEAELAEAISWYEKRGRGLGADFLLRSKLPYRPSSGIRRLFP